MYWSKSGVYKEVLFTGKKENEVLEKFYQTQKF